MKNLGAKRKKFVFFICFSLTIMAYIAIFIQSTAGSSATTQKVADFLDGNEFEVFLEGDYAYVASGKGGLKIYDISVPSEPEFISELDDIGTIYSVHVKEDFAYLAAGVDGFLVVDISDFNSMAIIASYPGGPDEEYLPNEIEVQGNYAFLASGTGGVEIFDISDPYDPDYVSNYDSLTIRVNKIEVNGSLMYVSNYFNDGNHRLEMVNISNIYSPKRIGAYSDGGSWINDICVFGEHVLIIDGDDGLEVLNVSNPSHITEIGNSTFSHILYGVCVNKTHAFITSHNNFNVLDLTDPTNPMVVGFRSMYFSESKLWYESGLVFVASIYYGGFAIFDVSNEFSPQLMVEIDDTMEIISISVHDNNVVAYGNEKLVLVDVTNPETPKVNNSYSEGYHRILGNSQDFIYYRDGYNLISLHIDTLSQAGMFESLNYISFGFVTHPYAFLFSDQGSSLEMSIVDIRDPTNVSALFIDDVDLDDFSIQKAVLEDELLYMIGYDWTSDSGKLIIYDLTNPVNPYVVTNYDIEEPTDIFVEGNTLYISTWDGLFIYDFSVIGSPNLITRYEYHYTVSPYTFIMSVYVEDDIIYCAGVGGIVILDVYDLENIEMLDHFEDDWAEKVVYREGYLYYTSMNNGIGILKVDLDLSDRRWILGYPITVLGIVSAVLVILMVQKQIRKR